MKVATYNCNSVRARLDIILGWLKKESPDALCLQETKAQDDAFPAEAFSEAGYNSARHGQKSYNGVAIISPHEMTDIRAGLCDGREEKEQARIIATTVLGVPIINTYVPQGFDPDSEKFAYKLEWLERLRGCFDKHYSPDAPLLWAGDFNIAPEPIDIYDPDGLEGHVGFHPDERAALGKLKEWGFVDVFRKHVPEPEQYTFWDYRLRGAVSRKLGWRIDHIWATRPLADRSTAAWIDLEPRRMEKPSDHTFLTAEFEL